MRKEASGIRRGGFVGAEDSGVAAPAAEHAKMATEHVKIIDQKMLKPLAKQIQEEWARWNKGGKNLQENVDKFFKERPVRKFFEKLAADLKKSSEEATAALNKPASRKADKELARQMADKYNVLGGAYQKLTDKYTVGKFLGEGGFGKVLGPI